MGYIRHKVAIAIIYDSDKKAAAAIEAVREEMRVAKEPLGVPDCIMGPMEGVNGYNTYVFAADGSKEGWNTSDLCDAYRDKFIAAAKLSPYPNIVVLQMGGDDGETHILSTTDTVDA